MKLLRFMVKLYRQCYCPFRTCHPAINALWKVQTAYSEPLHY